MALLVDADVVDHHVAAVGRCVASGGPGQSPPTALLRMMKNGWSKTHGPRVVSIVALVCGEEGVAVHRERHAVGVPVDGEHVEVVA